MDLLKDFVHPTLVSGNHFGGAGTNILIIGEQGFDTIDAMGQNTVRILLRIDIHSSTKTADAIGLSHRNNACLVGMRQNLGLLLIVVKDIVFHCVILLIGFRFVVGIIFGFLFGFALESLCDKCIHDILLFFRHGFYYIRDGFIILIFLVFGIGILFLFLIFLILFFRGIRVSQRQGHTGVDDCLIFRVLTMLQHRIDKCAGICALMHQTDFANASVYNIRAILLKLIRINRKRANITVFY